MGGAVVLLSLALAQERALVLLEGPGAHDEERVLQALTSLDYDEVARLADYLVVMEKDS